MATFLSGKVLVIEDDSALAITLRQVLGGSSGEQLEVRVANNAKSGLEEAFSWQPDVILLDLGLPDAKGSELLPCFHAELKNSKVCVISGNSELSSRVAALEAGSDDYLVKPFAAAELIARVTALLRRGRVLDGGELSAAGLVLNPLLRSAAKDGRPIELTSNEFDLLYYLMSRPSQVISRQELLEAVWEGKDRYPNTVDAYVKRLRLKIDGPDLIRTWYRRGYSFG